MLTNEQAQRVAEQINAQSRERALPYALAWAEADEAEYGARVQQVVAALDTQMRERKGAEFDEELDSILIEGFRRALWYWRRKIKSSGGSRGNA